MKSIIYINKFLACVFCLVMIGACKKNWLDEKPNKALVVPKTLQELQSLLDNSGIINFNQPALGFIGSDDYFFFFDQYQKQYHIDQHAYKWDSEVYEGDPVPDWDFTYRTIHYCNIVLEGIEKIEITLANQAEWNNAKGNALFCRSFAFFSLAQLFAKQYDAGSAANDLGIPLRLTSDINERIGRSSVKQTYDQIVNDLLKALNLLPDAQPTVNKYYRPDKATASALLARVYLQMGNYSKALEYANLCLQSGNQLVGYYTYTIPGPTSSASPFGFPGSNGTEVLYISRLINYGTRFDALVDTALYALYHTDDLRRSLFFYDVTITPPGKPYKKFRGNYTGASALFGGIALDEIYLIRAECYAREGNAALAIKDLNDLLRTRWRKMANGSSTYVDQIPTTAEDALTKILLERRKQLLFRDIRWADLKRLNKEPSRAVTLTRIILGTQYTLPPQDNKYVYAIPDNEIKYNPMPQNSR